MWASQKVLRSTQRCVYSDDEGKTWKDAPMNISPFKSIYMGDTRTIVEAGDGTLLAPCVGYLNFSRIQLFGCRTYSDDKGYTWGYPVHTRFHVSTSRVWRVRQAVPSSVGMPDWAGSRFLSARPLPR